MSFKGRITTLIQCYIQVTKVPKSRKHVIFPSIPPIYPWTNLWEYISNLLQPFLFLIALSYSSNGTHFVTNVFEKISVTITYPQGHPIYIIFIMHLTTNYLWYYKFRPKNLSYSTLVNTVFINHYGSGIKLVISPLNVTQNFIKQLPENSSFMCGLTFSLDCSKRKYMIHGCMVDK